MDPLWPIAMAVAAALCVGAVALMLRRAPLIVPRHSIGVHGGEWIDVGSGRARSVAIPLEPYTVRETLDLLDQAVSRLGLEHRYRIRVAWAEVGHAADETSWWAHGVCWHDDEGSTNGSHR